MAKTYGEQIAEWRTQRQQQQVADRVHEIRSQYAQVQRERDQAIAENRNGATMIVSNSRRNIGNTLLSSRNFLRA
jgi:hypothetical protein